MIVADLSRDELARRLKGPGIRLRTGPVVTRIQSQVSAVLDGIALHYSRYPIEPPASFADFHVRVVKARGIRRWIRPQVLFQFDGAPPFLPLPGGQGFPMLEWGLNWCVSSHCHQYLIIHAAAIERAGHALLLPAPPGSGKSTLCAALVSRGWRLMSDELALLDPATGRVLPLPRPISLKGASIEAIRRFSPDAVLGPTVRDTLKGAVAHVTVPADSVLRAAEPACPRWLVLPRYEAGATVRLERLPKSRAFMQLADNAFNYDLHGRIGFETLARTVEACDSYTFAYGDLEHAVRACDRLAAGA